MHVLASQLHFLANRNARWAIPPLFWPVNCIKIGGHVALLSGPTVYSLYCDSTSTRTKFSSSLNGEWFKCAPSAQVTRYRITIGATSNFAIALKIYFIKYFTDACASNPCEHAERCVQDSELGYRCQQCHSKYHGPKCDERKILQLILK